jgi:hypothetical protein
MRETGKIDAFPSWSLGMRITGNRETENRAFPSRSLGMRKTGKIGKQGNITFPSRSLGMGKTGNRKTGKHYIPKPEFGNEDNRK